MHQLIRLQQALTEQAGANPGRRRPTGREGKRGRESGVSCVTHPITDTGQSRERDDTRYWQSKRHASLVSYRVCPSLPGQGGFKIQRVPPLFCFQPPSAQPHAFKHIRLPVVGEQPHNRLVLCHVACMDVLWGRGHRQSYTCCGSRRNNVSKQSTIGTHEHMAAVDVQTGGWLGPETTHESAASDA